MELNVEKGYFLKRAVDLLLGVTMLFLLSPFFVLVYIILKVSGCKQAFFVQKRAGLHGSTFNLLKFRTMSDCTDANGKLLDDHLRMHPLGNLLRMTSLDEIPQLINVIKGDMSIVGPRPLLPDYLPLYSEEQLKRHLVKPGITGMAQVNGRNLITWESKFNYDLVYVESCSLMLDIKILFKTLWVVFGAKGINGNHGLPLGRFTGTDESLAI
jgi:lipopolysaccharide/colanic/teichoic acid biosynthesis glycosyltransferase